ncbi:Ribosomal RNA small subunit methyltransferase I [Desulfurobacterium thermolithotrophum DSM 11699]|uniref:Ribosomal RNA small subunit methyltransferase I n=1 Tax=Desulfurobacterium thermolithotrophum (strain DSM 11699 / BSA) TaxID=868864 RepID=F0S460_DESTD|nr:16S rRNA (cytidine(1402)-2'-O)-methyltransferase [Desulfurobacterium thermolithotrophum]ADY73632.1 Ribosomal RNA small subunit methyltransferase I [Desulfurobacterium thermolithotrophum DSM 11699]
MHSSERIGKLYIVATPIGNLEDITFRALKVLKEVDLIACEDTRRTIKLLNYYKIPVKKLVPYHEHNERKVSKKLIKELLSGKDIALVSDAGTPCISDPGYRIVSLAREKKIDVIPIPGASAVIAALSASGFPTDRFLFVGFLPKKELQLKKTIKEISKLPYTVVAYESPHRLEKTLKILKEMIPEKKIGIYREITKLNEEFLEGNPGKLLNELTLEDKLKGEFVLLFYPSKEEKENENEKSLDEILLQLKEEGNSLKTTVKEACQRTGLPKNEVYKRALELFSRD